MWFLVVSTREIFAPYSEEELGTQPTRRDVWSASFREEWFFWKLMFLFSGVRMCFKTTEYKFMMPNQEFVSTRTHPSRIWLNDAISRIDVYQVDLVVYLTPNSVAQTARHELVWKIKWWCQWISMTKGTLFFLMKFPGSRFEFPGSRFDHFFLHPTGHQWPFKACYSSPNWLIGQKLSLNESWRSTLVIF